MRRNYSRARKLQRTDRLSTRITDAEEYLMVVEDPTSETRPNVLMLEGNFTFVQDWARAARNIADVTLGVGRDFGAGGSRPGIDADADIGVPIIDIPRIHLRPSRLVGPVAAAYQFKVLRRSMTELDRVHRRPDCLHSHFYSNCDGVVRLARRSGVPFVHTEHSSTIVNGRVSPSGKALLQEVCDRAASVFAVGHSLADAMRAYGVSRTIHVVHNPVDLAMFMATPIDTRRTPDESLRLVSVGWLLPSKDHETLIRSFARISKEFPDATLDIVGEGPLRNHLYEMGRSMKLETRIRFRGHLARSALARLLGSCHLYVHTSKAETFGVALVEAWASGLPVVTFDCGGVSRLADELGGRMVPERTVESMATTIIEEAARLSPLARRETRDKARIHFDSSPLIEKLDIAYRSARLGVA